MMKQVDKSPSFSSKTCLYHSANPGGMDAYILDALVFAFSSKLESEFTASPPLDEITVYSSAAENEDCASTCSSEALELDQVTCSLEVSSPSRSIFPEYWDKHRMNDAKLSVSLACPDLSSTSSSESMGSCNSSTNTNECVIKNSEQPHRRRRRIFSDLDRNYKSYQEPEQIISLVEALRLTENEVRKTKSSPVLSSVKPSTSCLRSGEKRQSSVSFVTFSPKVDVVYFERPKEFWANDGWSKFFAL